MGHPQITLKQLAFIIIVCALAAGNSSVLSAIFDFTGRDIYFALLLSAVYMLLLVSVYTKLCQRFPRHSVIQYAPAVMGKFLGKLIGVCYIIFFLSVPLIVTVEVIFMMLTGFSPEMPMHAIALLHLLPKIYLVWLGLETIARFTQLFTIPALTVLVMVVLLNIPNYQPQLLQPFIEEGLVPVLAGAALLMSRMGYFSFSLMVCPYLESKQKMFKTKIIAVAVITFALAATYSVVMVFGEKQTQNFLFPTLELIRMIEVANFLERLDPLLLGMWWFGYLIIGASFYYLACLAIQQWAGLSHYRQTVLPVAVLLLIAEYFSTRSNLELTVNSVYIYTPLMLIVTFLLPLLLLIIAAARGIDSSKIK